MATKVSEEQKRALVDHEAQINGEKDPHGTKLSDGRTVAQAQAEAERVNNDWEAERQKRKAEQAEARERARTAADAKPDGNQQKPATAKKTDAKQ